MTDSRLPPNPTMDSLYFLLPVSPPSELNFKCSRRKNRALVQTRVTGTGCYITRQYKLSLH